MKMSENVDALFAALSKFQGEVNNTSKGKQGHGYKYSDLAECINTAKEHLANNGLAVTQMLGMNEIGKQTLITMLTHSSGQFFMSEFVMAEAVLSGGSGKNPAQVLGSAITYQRRYSYAAILGLAQEDDDAASAGGGKKQQQVQYLSQKQMAELQALVESKGFTVQQACQTWNIQSLSAIVAADYQNVVNNVNRWG